MEFNDYEEYILSKTKETERSKNTNASHQNKMPTNEQRRVISCLINVACAVCICVIFTLSSVIEINSFTAVLTLVCILRLAYSLLTSIKW